MPFGRERKISAMANDSRCMSEPPEHVSCLLDQNGKNFAQRLSEERRRLRLSQADMGRIGGVSRTSQSIYENGHKVPDLGYLMRLRDAGADLVFLLSGERDGQRLGAVRISLDALSNIYGLIDEVCRNPDGSLQPFDVRMRVFQLLCAMAITTDSSVSSLNAIGAEFARLAANATQP